MNANFEIPLGTAPPEAPYSGKRLFDLGSSFALVLLTLPIQALLYIVLSLLNKASAFKTVEVVGRRGRVFGLSRFQATTLPGKRLLRTLSLGSKRRERALQSLPQLFSVLAGRMSLVGPKPHLLKKASFLDEKVDGYREQLLFLPGWVTPASLAPPDCNEQTLLEYTQLYVRTATLGNDFWLLNQAFLANLKISFERAPS